MGDLPAARITESRPFTNVGIDYCGPFYIKERKDRNRRKIKTYVAIFVCLAVKAVHIELVSDLTSKSAQQFTPTTVPTSLAPTTNYESFETSCRPTIIRRVAGNELLTFENFNTLIIEIESILNSRPLTPISSDPNDLLVLTPGHILIGDSLTSIRERDFRDTPTNRLSSWQHIQKLKQHFWRRWHREYLNELSIRNKWNKGNHDIREGTIVILREDNVPPMHWPLGRVVKIHPGADGIIRTATVQTSSSLLDRGVKRLVPLPCQSARVESGQSPTSKEVDHTPT
ncbi:uncharacterized protein [Bombus flavifrons]|uniref:uncharacterized protein n=1 Tax=Bombus flavifrons TaxID=103934 RepID=UPI0037049E34